MAKIDHTYNNLLEKILEEGYDYKDESRDVMCKQISSYEFRHNVRLNGFPAITTKKLYWKGVVGELIWFLRDDTNIKYLVDNNIHIWDKDAYNWYKKKFLELYPNSPQGLISFDDFIMSIKERKDLNDIMWQGIPNYKLGDLGRVYGAQWINFRGPSEVTEGSGFNSIDQISNLIQNLKDKPMSRRHIVTAWNPAELDKMALPPCHWAFEILPKPLSFWERCSLMYHPNAISTSGNLELVKEGLDDSNIPKYTFDLKWHQRSVDTFLGLPFNIASYGLLMEIIGKLTNMIPNELIGDLSNVHIYNPHIEAVKTQLKNQPDKYWRPIQLEFDKSLDQVMFNSSSQQDLTAYFEELKISDFKLKDYESYSAIPAEMLAPN